MTTTEIQSRIILEAGRMFTSFGIKSMTMDALAEEMGISKRTIYESFKDKDSLLLEVINYYRQEQMIIAREIMDKSENVVIALFKLVNSMINTMKVVNPVFFHDLRKYHSNIYKKISEKGDLRDHTMTLEIIRLGREQEIFSTKYNIEIVDTTLHELFNMFGPDSKLTRDGYHRADLFNNIIIPYLIGISTDKGRALILEQGTFNN